MLKVVLDSGVFMNTQEQIDLPYSEFYLSRATSDEIKSKLASNVFQLFLETHKVHILDPSKSNLDIIAKTIDQMGINKVSNIDKEVIALALQMSKEFKDVILISDDYGVRNIAEKLNITSRGYKNQKKVKIRRYILICKGCNANYLKNVTECEICGHTQFIRRRR